ncbi:hypothetical protein [Burkholderia ubonensis]|uniref:hypothetical protein n=1 Tax=Burkholderia ubonensis TaxID=101571 RepID=UPI0009B4B28B|nr:hypothetical protein [Burkholderia ubonensis]
MEIEVEVDGRRYVAEVHEVDGVVTIFTDAGGTEMTSKGGMSVEAIARIMLRRLVKNGKAEPKTD